MLSARILLAKHLKLKVKAQKSIYYFALEMKAQKKHKFVSSENSAGASKRMLPARFLMDLCLSSSTLPWRMRALVESYCDEFPYHLMAGFCPVRDQPFYSPKRHQPLRGFVIRISDSPALHSQERKGLCACTRLQAAHVHASRLNAFLRSPKLMQGALRPRARIIGLLFHLMAGFAPSANCPKQTHWGFQGLGSEMARKLLEKSSSMHENTACSLEPIAQSMEWIAEGSSAIIRLQASHECFMRAAQQCTSVARSFLVAFLAWKARFAGRFII
jgi:hypothetical protein